MLELSSPLSPIEKEMNQRNSRGGGGPGWNGVHREADRGRAFGRAAEEGSRITECLLWRLEFATKGSNRRPQKKMLASVCLERLNSFRETSRRWLNVWTERKEG